MTEISARQNHGCIFVKLMNTAFNLNEILFFKSIDDINNVSFQFARAEAAALAKAIIIELTSGKQYVIEYPDRAKRDADFEHLLQITSANPAKSTFARLGEAIFDLEMVVSIRSSDILDRPSIAIKLSNPGNASSQEDHSICLCYESSAERDADFNWLSSKLQPMQRH